MGEQNATEGYKPLELADVLDSFSTHAGLRCARVGDDGDVLILGHHDDAAIWAAFAALTGDDDGAACHDLRRTHVAWANHSEDCEIVGCSCEEDVCEPCRKGEHDGCNVRTCLCADDYDHDRPAQCPCECFCDDYAWWVCDARTNGEPATWVRWSYEKARARREAARAGAAR